MSTARVRAELLMEAFIPAPFVNVKRVVKSRRSVGVAQVEGLPPVILPEAIA